MHIEGIAVKVINLEIGKKYTGESSEELMMALRLHEQMLSCLNFVVEKAQRYHPEDPGMSALHSSVDFISDMRQKLRADFGANSSTADLAKK